MQIELGGELTGILILELILNIVHYLMIYLMIFRSAKDVEGRIAQVGPSVSDPDIEYSEMREGIAYALKSFQNAVIQGLSSKFA